MALRLSLDRVGGQSENWLRRGRAIGWIEDALSPLLGELSKPEVRRLAIAIRSVAGIEPLVWLTDVGRLSRVEAVEVMKASAQAVLRSAITDRKGKRPVKRT
jgi:hypothetical protein